MRLVDYSIVVRFAAVVTVPLALAGGAGVTTDGPGAQLLARVFD